MFVGLAGSGMREKELVDERKELQMMAGWRASFGCCWDDLRDSSMVVVRWFSGGYGLG